jgi:Transposase DDE domain
MSHQDKDRRVIRYNAEQLQLALQWLLGPVFWSSIQFREDCTWLPLQLAATALVWAWSDELTLGERFLAARRIAEHLYQPQQEFATTSQAFLKLLRRWTARLVGLVQACFRQRMQAALAAQWRLHGWIVFGVDGSRVDLPRTKSHEAAYAPSTQRAGKRKRYSRRKKPRDAAHTKKARTPQLWLTMLWHAGTGLPWSWRIGATDSSERAHWVEMLPELPEQALVAADAGYVGYEYLRAVIASGRHLLLRVGSHVRLLRKLGWAKESAGTVYLWPDAVAQKNQPPLVLRLVVSHNGKHPVYLLTSVLSPSRLSNRQIIDLYRQRWGIELFFRHLKQTFQRRKLRSASANNARVELEWSLVGLWGMALYAQVVLTAHQIAPARLSTACVLRAFRRLLRDYRHPLQRGQTLRARLRYALRDAYPRKNKSSRNYPRKKRPDPQPGPPEILPASPMQIIRARQLRLNLEKGLAA